LIAPQDQDLQADMYELAMDMLRRTIIGFWLQMSPKAWPRR